MSSIEIPACSGLPGPGLIKRESGAIFSASSIVIASLRFTIGSALARQDIERGCRQRSHNYQ